MGTYLRATPLGIDQNNILNLDANMNAQAVTQEQLSTGYQINQPSDNPGAIGMVLSSNALVDRTTQYLNNASDGLSFLTQANSVMNQVASLLDQAEQLVTELAGPASQMGTSSAPQQIGLQLQGIYTSLLSLANQTYVGIPIFGGTTGGNVAYDSAGNYVGTSTTLSRTVAPGLSLQASVVGSSVFGSGATGVFGVINQLVQDANNINAGTNTGLQQLISTDEGKFQDIVQQVQSQGAMVGSLYQAMQSAQQSAQQTQTVLKNQVSNLADVNVAQATTNLQEEQIAYQAALYATAQVNKYSLVQFVA